jgi:hypothetical protein
MATILGKDGFLFFKKTFFADSPSRQRGQF